MCCWSLRSSCRAICCWCCCRASSSVSSALNSSSARSRRQPSTRALLWARVKRYQSQRRPCSFCNAGKITRTQRISKAHTVTCISGLPRCQETPTHPLGLIPWQGPWGNIGQRTCAYKTKANTECIPHSSLNLEIVMELLKTLLECVHVEVTLLSSLLPLFFSCRAKKKTFFYIFWKRAVCTACRRLCQFTCSGAQTQQG